MTLKLKNAKINGCLNYFIADKNVQYCSEKCKTYNAKIQNPRVSDEFDKARKKVYSAFDYKYKKEKFDYIKKKKKIFQSNCAILKKLLNKYWNNKKFLESLHTENSLLDKHFLNYMINTKQTITSATKLNEINVKSLNIDEIELELRKDLGL